MFCTVSDGCCLCHIVMVDTGMNCELSFGKLPSFRYCVMVMARSILFLKTEDSCGYYCIAVAG